MRPLSPDHVAAVLRREPAHHGHDAILRAAAFLVHALPLEDAHAALVEEAVETDARSTPSDRSVRDPRPSRRGTSPRPRHRPRPAAAGRWRDDPRECRPETDRPGACARARSAETAPSGRRRDRCAGRPRTARRPRGAPASGSAPTGGNTGGRLPRSPAAVERHDALVAAALGSLVDGHGEIAGADKIGRLQTAGERASRRSVSNRAVARRRSGASKSTTIISIAPSVLVWSWKRPSNLRDDPSSTVERGSLADGRGPRHRDSRGASEWCRSRRRGARCVRARPAARPRTAERRHPFPRTRAAVHAPTAPRHHARMPFCAWRRFSASSKTTELRTVHDLVRHLLAAMGGKAMHEDGIVVGHAHQRAVDLIRLQAGCGGGPSSSSPMETQQSVTTASAPRPPRRRPCVTAICAPSTLGPGQ